MTVILSLNEYILLGVKDNGEITGIPPDQLATVQQWIENICQNNCDPPLNPIVTKLLLPDTHGVQVPVLKVEILRSIFAHATSGGLWYHRVGSSKQKLSPQALARLPQQRSQGYAFEEKIIPQANFADIDVELYKKHHELRQLGPLDESILPIADLLVNLKIAGREEGKILPTVVGLLMFGKHPQKYLPNATVDCAIYSGSVPDSNCLINATSCTGTVAEQIVRAAEFVKRYMEVPAQKNEAGRQDLPQYSLRAVHEAIVNAVAHRDYSIAGSSIRLFMFDDRIELSSPGRLPNTVTIESLYTGAIPYRRNQILVGFLKDYVSPITMRAFMESRGEGVLLIIRESEKISGRKPLYEEVGETVKLTIYGRENPNRQ
ncbi:putative DNA binding domain-containing protein [candidate division KSB1 bacterium]|nr:putative DNA binding domain-containing protein [candidate division KSB1 bacterium]